MKKWWTSKSVWLGALICLGGIAEYLAGVPAGASIATIVAGVLAIIIRVVTKQSLGK